MSARLALALVAVAAACAPPPAGVDPDPGQVDPDRLDPATATLTFSRATTSGDIAVRNLDAQIQGAADLLARQPGALDLRETLVGLLLARVQFLGTFGDFDRALLLADDGVALQPTAPRALALRAQARAAVHDFAGSRADVEAAIALGMEGLEPRLELIELSTRCAPAAAGPFAPERPMFDSLAAAAGAAAAGGAFADADALFREALRVYRDVSPFPVAWVQFQRGVMWAEQANRPDLALPLYREAVRRLPRYVSANVHLAELELWAGDADGAVARLLPLVGQTEDPEPASRLSQWLAAEAGAADYGRAADAAYTELLARHAAAFADHASEFYVSVDPARALALATANLEVRRDARAWLVALRAALAAGAHDRACDLAAAAAVCAINRNLDSLRAEVTPTCR